MALDIYKTLRTALITGLVGSSIMLSEFALNSCRTYGPENHYIHPGLQINPASTSRPAVKDNNDSPKFPDFNNEPLVKIARHENARGNCFGSETDSCDLLDLGKLEYVTNFDQNMYNDPNNSGNGLFKVKQRDLDRLVSPHFRLRELVSSGGKIPEYARLDPELVQGLEILRQTLDRPIIINSSYRSKDRQSYLIKNKKTKAKKSRHSSGEAVDLKVSGFNGKEISIIARRLFPKAGIGVGKDFIHLDFRGKRADWRY